ncbi:MAG: hypothetical protein PHS92_02830 [Candidatus Gracilibacteria bacterium]|nr:hypothetical protein [Candidatus Gracilibacteria bacterium]
MSMIVCRDYSDMTPEQMEAELDNSPDLFIINEVLKIDSLNIQSTLDKVWKRVKEILGPKGANSAAASKISELYVKSRFQASCTDLFFREPPRDGCEGARQGPIACIYSQRSDLNGRPVTDKDNKPVLDLSFVNNSYITATGIIDFIEREPEKWRQCIGDFRYNNKKLTLADHIKFLANETKLIKELADENNPEGVHVSKLYLLIYDAETIRRIYNNYKKLDTDGGYEDVFEMKLTRVNGVKGTGKFFLWKTLKHDRFLGNIRSAIEVKKGHILIERLRDERRGIVKSVLCNDFGFYKTIEDFRRNCDVLLKGRFDNQFNELKQFAAFGDTFINESFYATRGFDGLNHYINKQYVINSPFTSAGQIEHALNNRTFNDIYFGKGSNDITKSHLDSLLKESGGHYNEKFTPVIDKNPDGTYNRVSMNFDTFLIDGPDYLEFDMKPDKTFRVGALI